MSETTPNLFSYLGKPIKDEHGHTIGTMASFQVTPGGRVDGVFIEHGDGHIKKYSSDQIQTNNGEIVLFSSLKMKADSYCNQIPLLWRKTQAIKVLKEKQKIPEEMFNDLYSSFEGALNQVKEEAERLISEIDDEIEKCGDRVKELNSALVNLEIEKEIGQIDEESYQTAIQMLKDGLKRFNSEKEDFESFRNQLTNMNIGEKPHEATEEEIAEQKEEPEITLQEEEQAADQSPEPLTTSLPEPPTTSTENPVVVYVKNAEDQDQ